MADILNRTNSELSNDYSAEVYSYFSQLESVIGSSCTVNLLNDRVLLTALDMPVVSSENHTMSSALDDYVTQKLPVDALLQTINYNFNIEIHGVFPDYFEKNFLFLGFSSIELIDFKVNKIEKEINFLRPCFYRCTNVQGESVLVVAVLPSSDYLQHYTSMIQYFVQANNSDYNRLLSFRYPYFEKRLLSLTSFDDLNVSIKGVLIMGYVNQLAKQFENDKNCFCLEKKENDYYTVYKYLVDQCVVTLLAVKYSFWGNASANIIKDLIDNHDISEIIYFAKLGCLDDPKNIYSKIYCPSHYYVFNHDQIVHDQFTVRNNFLNYHSYLDTGSHLSVSTILEEDYTMRNKATELSINSIDNEISQMAWIVKNAKQSISFTALHFATDYIRRPEESSLFVDYDLSNNRTEKAVLAKKKMQHKIMKLIINYIKSKGVYEYASQYKIVA